MITIDLKDEASAVAAHADLRRSGASPLAFGRLYGRCLELGLWPNQRTLANALGTTPTRVSRCLAANRLPPELLRALHNARSVSYRSLMTMIDIVNSTGDAVARERAKRIPPRCTFSQIKSFLLGMEVSSAPSPAFRISAGPRNRYLRIDTPHVVKILAKQKEFEDLLQFVASITLSK
jgi:hypothetical protein